MEDFKSIYARAFTDKATVAMHPYCKNNHFRDIVYLRLAAIEGKPYIINPHFSITDDIEQGELIGIDLIDEKGKLETLGDLGFVIIDHPGNYSNIRFTENWIGELQHAGRPCYAARTVICATVEMRHLAAQALSESDYPGNVTESGAAYVPPPAAA